MTNDRYLFRGFHKCDDGSETIYIDRQAITGKWVYGYLVEYTYKDTVYMNGTSPKTSYIFPMDERSQLKSLEKKIEVIPETIGQYLNKQDKNDKKIFENDLLKGCEDMYDDEVIGTPVLNLENGLQLHCKDKIYHFDYIYDEEVIGTKFDKEVNDNE